MEVRDSDGLDGKSSISASKAGSGKDGLGFTAIPHDRFAARSRYSLHKNN